MDCPQPIYSARNFQFTRGDTLTIPAQYASITPGDPPVVTPIDLTGATIWFTCKQYREDPDDDALFQLTNGSGVTITSPTTGNFNVVIPSVDTAGLACGVKYPYDCVIEPAGGGRFTVLSGWLMFGENTTDA